MAIPEQTGDHQYPDLGLGELLGWSQVDESTHPTVALPLEAPEASETPFWLKLDLPSKPFVGSLDWDVIDTAEVLRPRPTRPMTGALKEITDHLEAAQVAHNQPEPKLTTLALEAFQKWYRQTKTDFQERMAPVVAASEKRWSEREHSTTSLPIYFTNEPIERPTAEQLAQLGPQPDEGYRLPFEFDVLTLRGLLPGLRERIAGGVWSSEPEAEAYAERLLAKGKEALLKHEVGGATALKRSPELMDRRVAMSSPEQIKQAQDVVERANQLFGKSLGSLALTPRVELG